MKEVMKSIGITALIVVGVASACALLYFVGSFMTGGPTTAEGWVGGSSAILLGAMFALLGAIWFVVYDYRTSGRK